MEQLAGLLAVVRSKMTAGEVAQCKAAVVPQGLDDSPLESAPHQSFRLTLWHLVLEDVQEREGGAQRRPMEYHTEHARLGDTQHKRSEVEQRENGDRQL